MIRVARDEAHLLHGRDDAPHVARDRALQEGHDALAHARGDARRGAEIEEHENGIAATRSGSQQQVPRVRIRVVHAVDEDLFAVGLDAQARRLGSVDTRASDAGQIAHLHTIHPLGDQHAPRAMVAKYPRNQHIGAASEIARDGGHGLGLLTVVQLGHDHLLDLAVEDVPSPVGQEAPRESRNALERAQVGGHDGLNVGILNLDRDLLPRT